MVDCAQAVGGGDDDLAIEFYDQIGHRIALPKGTSRPPEPSIRRTGVVE